MPRHEEQKTLAYTADELFSVVANVKDYPSFVPWCTGARIHRETPKEIIAELDRLWPIPGKLHQPGHAGSTAPSAGARD
jgi:hypothetical protein